MASACLAALQGDGSCLERVSFALPQPSNFLPVYVAHARGLTKRRAHIEAQLRRVGAPDATFVMCGDVGVVNALDPALYGCLHPQYTRTDWSRPGVTRLPNGTLSLALKHRLAHADALRRGLNAALVLEDDAVLPPNFWTTLSVYMAAMPADASLFFIGSYSRSTNPKLTLANHPKVSSSRGTLLQLPSAASSDASGVEVPPLHRRLNGTLAPKPHILGTVAYVVLARGARHLGTLPIRAEADVDLSLLTPTSRCGATSPSCRVGAPPSQYGPSRWLVWQDEGLSKQTTHGQKNSVRDGWERACRNAEPSSAAASLLKACKRYRMPIGTALEGLSTS